MPLPNTRLIPERWSEHHQPAVESAMVSTVDILRPKDEIPAPDPWGDPADTAPDVLVPNVPARIRALLRGENQVAPSGQTFNTQGYLVQVPAGTLPELRVGKDGTSHRLRVTHNPRATGIVGQVMQILAAPHESEAFNRDLWVQVHTDQ